MRGRWMGAVSGLSVGVLAIGLPALGLLVGLTARAEAQTAAARGLTQPGMVPLDKVRLDKVRADKARDDLLRRRQCRHSTGAGSAPTERLARLQAWERVAQATGNWPVVTDTFKQERYRCRKDGTLWQCRSSIEICRST